MEYQDSQAFKEVLVLIPQIVSTGKLCLQRELDASVHDAKRLQAERLRFQDAFSFIQGKWTIDVLYMVFVLGEPNYNQILQVLAGINSRTLTDRLKLLEDKGILHRTLHDARPVRVTYKITDKGKSLIALLLPAVLFCGWPELIETGNTP